MYKECLISELERWIEFVERTKLIVPGSGHKDYDKYPPNTPGVHPYWDSELFNDMDAKLLIHWLKTDEILEHHQFLNRKKTIIRINWIYYLLLNPQYDTLIVGECNRGMDLLLALCIKEDWKKIYCYDTDEQYEPLIKEFFNDDRITFYPYRSERFDMDMIPEDNVILVLSHTHDHAIQRFMKSDKVKMIVKEGVKVDRNIKSYLDHKPLEILLNVYEHLKEEVKCLTKIEQ